MPWIQNIGKLEVPTGAHKKPRGHAILIQILDPASTPPDPLFAFHERYQFEFLDLDYPEIARDPVLAEFAMQPEHAQKIAQILQDALAQNADVVVHCTAGVARSGAVVAAAVALGFEDLHEYRHPNLFVKHALLKELALPYDLNEPSVDNMREHQESKESRYFKP